MSTVNITLEEVKAYLATLEPDQKAGIRYNSYGCLVARALKHKYKVLFSVGVAGLIPVETDELDACDVSPEIADILIDHDMPTFRMFR